MVLSAETSQPSDNLLSWNVTVATGLQIDVSLIFGNPIEVSQGETPDELLVRFKVGKWTDTDGLTLPPNLIKKVNLPTLLVSAGQALAL